MERNESARQTSKDMALTEDFSRTKRFRSARRRPRRPNPAVALMNAWWDRLLGAASGGGFSDAAEEYEAHSTSRDYVWNTIGLISWGALFPVLTIVVTQLSGAERAGMFSIAFVTANLLYFMGNYGVRTYQISDLEGLHSFKDYQVNRLITCVLMVVAGAAWCAWRGYDPAMTDLCAAVVLFKMVDALADVYEGRLQQADKLYLGGISQTIRSLLALVVFVVLLAITGSLVAASMGMFVAAALTFLIVTFPLALFETPKSEPLRARGVSDLFRACAPLFFALFMYALVDNMPKFVMDGVLSYDNQLYFNALYFPAQAVLLTVGFIYKPQLVRMAELWADVSHRRRFDVMILVMVLVIVAVTLLAAGGMSWIGITLLSFMYGLDFSQYADLAFIMLAAGGVTAGIDFLYQVIVILRRQRVVTELYFITFGFSLLVLLLMVNITGLEGAVIGYLIIMSILFVLLVREYVSVRIAYEREPGFEALDVKHAPEVNSHALSASVVGDALLSDDRERARRKLRARQEGFDASDPRFNEREDARMRLTKRGGHAN